MFKDSFLNVFKLKLHKFIKYYSTYLKYITFEFIKPKTRWQMTLVYQLLLLIIYSTKIINVHTLNCIWIYKLL